MAWCWASLLAVLWPVSVSAAGQQGMLDEQRSYLPVLAKTVSQCLSRKDTAHSVFHGCIDWHSAVHAHWALLRVYRVTGDEKLLHQVTDSLQLRALTEESALLKSQPDFEMPYGRAWFLLLAEEYQRATGEDTLLLMADDVAASLLIYLNKRNCDLQAGEYRNQSWVYLRLIRYYQYIGAAEKVLALKDAVTQCDYSDLDFVRDEKLGFFSVYGNAVHLLERVGCNDHLEALLKEQPVAEKALVPISQPTESHHLSINYSRAWGFWSLYKVTGEQRYLNAYTRHIQQNYALHGRYRNEYLKYGHWVSQFGIYAITERFVDNLQKQAITPEQGGCDERKTR